MAKRGRPAKPKRLSDGSLNLTPSQRSAMAYLLRRFRRAPLKYGWWDHNLASDIAKRVGVWRETASRWVNDPAFREEYCRRTLAKRRATPGDPVADLLMGLEEEDATREDVARGDAQIIRQHLEKDDYEAAIRHWVLGRTTIK